MAANEETDMAIRSSVSFIVGDESYGEVNPAFILDDSDIKKDDGISSKNDDERESDYYSGSPVDSLKHVDEEEADGISESAGTTKSRSGSALKARFYKSHVMAGASKFRMKLESLQKWRDLTMGTSLVYAICLTIIFLALLVSDTVTTATVTESTVSVFLVVMFSVSTLAIGFILALCALGKVTNDEHYKKRGKSTFIRGGMMVLGTGMIIYSFLGVATYIHTDMQCRTPMDVITAIFSIPFAVAQISFLLIYNKIRINRSLSLGILGRYLLMQVIATNLCVWLGVVFYETLEEIHEREQEAHSDMVSNVSSEYKTDADNDITMISKIYIFQTDINGSCSDTELQIGHILTPYLFPLMIEFCVMASVMCLALWENCGNGWMKKPPAETEEIMTNGQASTTADSDSLFTIAKAENSSHTQANHGNHSLQSPSYFFNNNLGFVSGWVVIVGTVVLVVLVLYYLYSGVNDHIKDEMMYGLNLALSLLCLIAVPYTMYSMSVLTFKDDEIKALRVHEHEGLHAPTSFKGIHRKTDKTLLFNTYIAMMTFKIFVMISAFEKHEPVIFIDGIVSILFGFAQTLFINWYAFQKRATLEEDRKVKPGRQGLEFLRCANFALWLVNTFLLKNRKAKETMYDTFGGEAWAILSNIFQPLTILYYFHAMVCLAEVIGHTYTAKYVGVTRPWKGPKVRQRHLPYSASANSLRSLRSTKTMQSDEFTTF